MFFLAGILISALLLQLGVFPFPVSDKQLEVQLDLMDDNSQLTNQIHQLNSDIEIARKETDVCKLALDILKNNQGPKTSQKDSACQINCPN